MAKKPWLSGPSEILQHANSLLKADSDVNRRLAFLSIDNAIELIVKTYLSLPTRVTGIRLSRKQFEEISESFPKLLNTLENKASDKLTGIDLGEIEWYHRLRNQLYHQGNGLTVEREKVDGYAGLAEKLFKILFDTELNLEVSKEYDILIDFLVSWDELEWNLAEVVSNYAYGGQYRVSNCRDMTTLREMGFLSEVEEHEIKKLEELYKSIVRGEKDFRAVLTPEVVLEVKEYADWLIKKI